MDFSLKMQIREVYFNPRTEIYTITMTTGITGELCVIKTTQKANVGDIVMVTVK